MWKELYTLFMAYQNKKLDDEFIYKSFNIMINNENLDYYINDFKFI